MFRTIVWATDGSELADHALEIAKPLAWQEGSKIVAVHVDQLLYGHAGGQSRFVDEPEIRERLRGQVELLRLDEIDAELKICHNTTTSVAYEVARVATEVHADLIVIATHARGAVGALVQGSVSRTLLHYAHCPVMVVPVTHLALAQGEVVEVEVGSSVVPTRR